MRATTLVTRNQNVYTGPATIVVQVDRKRARSGEVTLPALALQFGWSFNGFGWYTLPLPARRHLQRTTVEMLVLIDNYDSFTYNLVHYLGELGEKVSVWRNDAITVDGILADGVNAVVISPGPCDPDRAGICLELVRRSTGRLPLLGVCLGHQAVGQAFGGRVIRAPLLMHGKTSEIRHRGEGLFDGLTSPFTATRYHSLIVERDTLPECLAVTAETDHGTIMGLAHRSHPVFGVQFHPESIESEHGHDVLRNFLTIAARAR